MLVCELDELIRDESLRKIRNIRQGCTSLTYSRSPRSRMRSAPQGWCLGRMWPSGRISMDGSGSRQSSQPVKKEPDPSSSSQNPKAATNVECERDRDSMLCRWRLHVMLRMKWKQTSSQFGVRLATIRANHTAARETKPRIRLSVVQLEGESCRLSRMSIRWSLSAGYKRTIKGCDTAHLDSKNLLTTATHSTASIGIILCAQCPFKKHLSW